MLNTFMTGNMELPARQAAPSNTSSSRTSSGKVWDADGTRPYRAIGSIARSKGDDTYVPWPQKRNLLSLVSATGFQHSRAPTETERVSKTSRSDAK
jgi:hypothetical protein